MTTAVARGSYYKSRTKKFLEQAGFVVAFLERVLYIQGKHGLVPIKRDQLGSDVLAVSCERVVFAQVKSGVSWRGQLASARREFAKYPLAPGCEQWILGWLPQARQPVIEVVARGPQRADHPVEKAVRKKPKVLPLFSAGGR
jgi:hypothetical protein